MADSGTQKLQKVLAQHGVASRREIETWIEDGRVRVNKKIAHIGQRVCSDDDIEVDGEAIDCFDKKFKTEILLYHKPEGEICTRDDPEGRDTVFDNLEEPVSGKWISVGRLDYNTSGLLIFTNNGELANRLMHPSSNIEREYAVRILGEITPEHTQQLLKGVELEDGIARFNSISEPAGRKSNKWIHVRISEGRNREVRRMWEHLGFKVSRLIRVAYGRITLELKTSEYRKATAEERQKLYSMARMPLPSKK